MENSMLKWYGHLVRMEDKRWPKRIMACHRKEDDDEANLK